METPDKIKQVAHALGVQPKRFSANDKGYLTVITITRGCSVFLHRNKNDTFTLDLKVSKTARGKDPELVKTTINLFNSFFEHKTREYVWRHGFDLKDERDDYEYDVTLLSPDQIVSIVRNLKGHLLG